METLKRRIDLFESYDNDNSLAEMISHKLKEFNFYSADEKKGKSKVSFSDEEINDIAREFDDLIKKYPEDIAFVRAVVISKGMDKKTEQPIIKLGSYDTKSEIRLFPSNKSLGDVLQDYEGGVVYFTIDNKPGPDNRDFRIVKGDRLKNMDFKKEPEKKDEPLRKGDVSEPFVQKPKPELPFEKQMLQKEKRGLGNLLNTDEPTNDLTKRQKEVIKSLKKEGYKFTKPEQADIYERVRINTKEFNESINAWRPKKR
jgi:hypothetical protein